MRAHLWGALGVAVAIFAACGDDGNGGNSGTPDDGGLSGDGNPNGSDGGPPPPTPSPFGLDTRPSNTTCVAKPRPVLDTPVKLDPAFPGLTFNQPIYITQAPGDATRWYVVERPGTLKTFVQGATTNAQVSAMLTLDGNNGTDSINTSGEGGFHSIAFPPDFATSRYFYLSYTRNAAVQNYGTNMRSTLARVHSTNGTSVDGAPVQIFDVGQPYNNHDGGFIQFGQDGMLYFGLGDGGSGNDPLAAGQDLTHPLGKILRFDVSNTAGTYVVPSDNPFTNAANARSCTGYEPPSNPGPGGAGPCKEIWAYGFRNPWRWSFDKTSGELWVGDVGQDTWEEVDARVQKGGNYGWKLCEGKHVRGSSTQLCTTPGLILPIVEHPRSEAQSITGGFVYRGAAMPSLQGTYVYGDYVTGNIWGIVYDNQGQPSSKLLTTVPGQTLVSFGQGNDGEIYAVLISGTIRKLVPNGALPPDTFPKTLSASGCADPNDATKPAPGLVPYDLVSPLWSDGAEKKRYMGVPDGKTITVKPDGDWDYPNGTVLVKHFSVAGKRVETRLLMRHDDGAWAGYTYEWNDAQTDATLLPAAKTKPVGNNQTWSYPSRSQCLLCHTVAAGGVLGPETFNMNRDVVYESTNRISPQLATLDHIGMFAAAPPANPPTMAAPSDTNAAIDARARAYLHSNCSHCHRPNGGGQGTMDLRWPLALKDTNTCNANNTQGAVAGADKLITPGDPTKSILSLRVHATDSKRMPQIAVSILDPVGSQVIDDWIKSIATCP